MGGVKRCFYGKQTLNDVYSTSDCTPTHSLPLTHSLTHTDEEFVNVTQSTLTLSLCLSSKTISVHFASGSTTLKVSSTSHMTSDHAHLQVGPADQAGEVVERAVID